MKQIVKITALGLSATCFALAVDAVLGIGTAQWLADLCLTDPSGNMAGMAMGPVSPYPFLGLSVVTAMIGLGILAQEDRDVALGRTPPTVEEHQGILSAIAMAAATTGKTTESDIANIFQIVTGKELAPELAEYAYRQYRAMTPEMVNAYTFDPIDAPLARRRIMAAALLVGCVVHEPSAKTMAFIESLAFSTGSTPEDVAAAKAALTKWSDTDAKLTGSPLITLLRGKSLGLRPA